MHDSGGEPIGYNVAFLLLLQFFWDSGFAALDLIINDYYMLACAAKDAL